MFCSHDRTQALEEQKRVRHTLVAFAEFYSTDIVLLETGEARGE
jgi:hypothetical protein